MVHQRLLHSFIHGAPSSGRSQCLSHSNFDSRHPLASPLALLPLPPLLLLARLLCRALLACTSRSAFSGNRNLVHAGSIHDGQQPYPCPAAPVSVCPAAAACPAAAFPAAGRPSCPSPLPPASLPPSPRPHFRLCPCKKSKPAGSCSGLHAALHGNVPLEKRERGAALLLVITVERDGRSRDSRQ